MCGALWKSRDVLHRPSNTDLAIVFFFLTGEIKLVLIYCHDVDDEYDELVSLVAVKGALLPACVCMKGAVTV